MMRTVLFALLLLCCSVICRAADQPELKPLRQKIVLAMNSKKTTDSLYESLDKQSNKPPIIIAYLGILDALKAKHAWNPYSKIKSLNAAQSLLQKAVGDEPHNMEIRFLRFSVQHNAPGFLGYGKNLDEDKDEIMIQLAMKRDFITEKDLNRTIIQFLLDSKRCKPDEVKKLNAYLTQVK